MAVRNLRRRAAPVDTVMQRLADAISGMELPAVEKISNSQAEDPFQILIATLLSARTQDATTHAASMRLFRRARTPRTMARLSVAEIEELIYPVRFYRNKARHVKACCEALVKEHGGRVPRTLEELVALPGVGRKTANLVLILAFKSAGNICVDTRCNYYNQTYWWRQAIGFCLKKDGETCWVAPGSTRCWRRVCRSDVAHIRLQLEGVGDFRIA